MSMEKTADSFVTHARMCLAERVVHILKGTLCE